MSVDPGPWYRRVYRWGQTNLTEIDYDAAFLARAVGERLGFRGVIVAYYSSKYSLHHRALKLGDRDLYGEIVKAAREDGLALLARVDSSRADAVF